MLDRSIFVSLAIVCSTPATVLAQQSAHVHGFAEINLAIDDGELQIEFASPAHGIVGFEYEPSTAAERRAVADAITMLRNPDNMFVLPASAGCKLHEVETEWEVEGEHAGHEGHGDEHDEHERHAEHDEHDDAELAGREKHEDGHGELDEHAREGSGDGGTHSEFYAHYHFDCNGSAIETVGLRLFETWPRIEEVRVQALTPTGQTGGSIHATDPVIRLQ